MIISNVIFRISEIAGVGCFRDGVCIITFVDVVDAVDFFVSVVAVFVDVDILDVHGIVRGELNDG